MALTMTRQVSLHGNRLGITSSGGLIFNEAGSTRPSLAVTKTSAGVVIDALTEIGSSVTAYKSAIETVSSSAGTMVNYGLSVISSDVINASVLSVEAPELGIEKEVFGDSSASTISLNTTSSDITFGTTVNSSALVFDKAGGVRGSYIRMRGLSTSRWAVLYHTPVS